MDNFSIPTLETERLWLRPLRESDADDYAALNADPEVMLHIGEPWDPERSWRHLTFLLGHWLLRGTGSWAVEHKETGAFAGIAGFFEPKGWPGFELAGRLGRRWWGNSYAAEAARAALDHAFNVWKRDRVISIVHPANRASGRLVERIGEKLLDRIEHVGREMLCYGIDREGWAAARSFGLSLNSGGAVPPSGRRTTPPVKYSGLPGLPSRLDSPLSGPARP